jgi:lipoyl(octanoyl) transferase
MSHSLAPWRLLLGDPAGQLVADGPTNMAVDAALLESVRAGGPPAVRFYRWSPACLSFGRNQPANGRYDVDAASARGIEFVRRPTGGQAVLHDQEVTYAVVAPVEVVGRPREAYRRINQGLVGGLRRLRVPAEVAGGAPGPASAPVDWGRACFRTPESGEVVVGGRKLVGSAQRTEGRVILQHGSILTGGSQSAAEELLVGGVAPAGDALGWTTVARELSRVPDVDELIAALIAGLEDLLGTSLAPSRLTAAEASAAERLGTHFASASWTWRL